MHLCKTTFIKGRKEEDFPWSIRLSAASGSQHPLIILFHRSRLQWNKLLCPSLLLLFFQGRVNKRGSSARQIPKSTVSLSFFPPLTTFNCTNSYGWLIRHCRPEIPFQGSESENERRYISSRPCYRPININFISLLVVITPIFLDHLNIQSWFFLR